MALSQRSSVEASAVVVVVVLDYPYALIMTLEKKNTKSPVDSFER